MTSTAPAPYLRLTSFSGQSPYRDASLGVSMDNEFNAIQVAINAIETRLSLIQRNDGNLMNGSVGPDQLGGGLTSQPFPSVTTLGIGVVNLSPNVLTAGGASALFSNLPGGTDFKLFLSKAAVGNSASVVFQDNFSTKADIGLSGDDNLHFRTSSDGITFSAPMVITSTGVNVVTPPASDNSQRIATTAFVATNFVPQLSPTFNGTATFTGPIVAPQFPGLTTSVLGTSLSGLSLPSTGALDSTWVVSQVPTTTTAALQPALYVRRSTLSLTGGTTSTGPSALLVLDFSGRNDVSWNVGAVVNFFNQSLGSNAGQNAAATLYAFKQNSTGGGEVCATWGLNTYCWDQQPTVNPAFSSIGAEIDCYVSAGGGTDTSANRAGLTIACGVTGGTDAAVHVGTAIQIATVGLATIDRGLSYFAGVFGSLITTRGGTVTAVKGIDWGSVVFSGNQYTGPGHAVDLNGNIILSSGTPVLTFNAPVVSSRGFVGQTNGVLRWQVLPGNATAEGGANAGSDLTINAYADGGGFLATPLTIKRSSGLTTLTSLSLPVSANAAVATVLGSVGPAGSHTTVQEWIQVVGTGGAIRYVPGF